MEFPFDVNHILPFETTILNGDYRILNPEQPARIVAPEKLTSIIDAIGDASYKAQGLHGAVTTARKFRMSDHRLYIIKKADDNKNLGSVVGLLKVGSKHLYIYDSNGQVYERTPLCVSDFYVHESKQRLGYGKKLFETMLNFEKCTPVELAIDRPSNKCLAFLHKHYNLSSPIHQVNNFVVYQGFFNQSPIVENRKLSTTKQNQTFTSWLLPSERQQQQHRSFTEHINMENNPSIRTFTNENHQQLSTTQQNGLYRNSSVKDNRQPVSFLPQQTDRTQYTPRIYSQVFNHNNSNPHLSQKNSNNIHLPVIEQYRRPIEFTSNISKSQQSLIKSTNNQQQSHPSSTTWRIFGTPQLYY
ncbi:unnamed protein product [Adineta steineri]|uniref:Alpha-tubulin N-acetyltransferase n=1 Tax=Adineta steineri TaxID=433720 RepID=A0A813QWW4_9BILA|nr:unnamed protein product [Adineta steineri]